MNMLAEIQAKLKAPKDKKNASLNYAYRNAEGILRAFKDVAPKNASLTISDEITFIGDRLFLVATATLFDSGAVVASAKGVAMHALAKKGMDDAQITGACSSYARKYALCGLFAIDDSADDPDSKDNRRAHEEAAEIAHERAVTDAQTMIESAEDLPDLQKVWASLARDVRADKRVADAKDKRKAELQPPPAMSETARLAHDAQAPE